MRSNFTSGDLSPLRVWLQPALSPTLTRCFAFFPSPRKSLCFNFTSGNLSPLRTLSLSSGRIVPVSFFPRASLLASLATLLLVMVTFSTYCSWRSFAPSSWFIWKAVTPRLEPRMSTFWCSSRDSTKLVLFTVVVSLSKLIDRGFLPRSDLGDGAVWTRIAWCRSSPIVAPFILP